MVGLLMVQSPRRASGTRDVVAINRMVFLKYLDMWSPYEGPGAMKTPFATSLNVSLGSNAYSFFRRDAYSFFRHCVSMIVCS